ncbi:DUF1772 domain-containing protein [Micromonospora mirobrigensis]|uniref:Uncharacterized membrane protein n=1 Tax=Micromonospora mirobrigensis TaxID=262898 RepID=A0A1C4X2G3_9ACTN|nr:anthrone oxygenase family protein [Micromonospora mirobrigensis]SCF02643.1 Uncharacterized membrane protein [Micromonospora mirobrigensis]
MSGALRGLALGTALAGAVTGGVFVAFSTFVMPALGRLPADQAMRAMQAVNAQAPRSLLMVPLVGSAVGCLAVAGWALFRADLPGRGWLLVGAGAGLVAFAVTAAYHVPHNDALARLRPAAPGSAEQWARYASAWTRWNHARAVAALVSAAALVVGVLDRR